MERVEEIFKEKNPIVNKSGAIKKETFDSSIRYKNVFFKYPESDDYVLKNIDLEIDKGEKIALIGASGAGKTTMADLLSRFYDVSKGKILMTIKSR